MRFGLEYVLNALDRQAEYLTSDRKGDKLGDVGVVLHRGSRRSRRLMQIVALLLDRRDETGRSNLATKSWKPTPRPRSIASAETRADSAMTGKAEVFGFSRKRCGKLEPVHLGHLDIGHDNIERRRRI